MQSAVPKTEPRGSPPRLADRLVGPVLTCLSPVLLQHGIWTVARKCFNSVEEDEGILDFCRVKHLKKLQDKTTW